MPKPIRKTSDCPECGSDELELYRKSWEKNDVLVWCKRCGHEGPKADAMVEAIRVWNEEAEKENRESSLQEHLKTPIKKGFGSHVTGFREPEDGTAIRFQWKGQWFRAAIKSNGDIIVERSVDGQFLKTDETTRVMEIFLNYVQDHG